MGLELGYFTGKGKKGFGSEENTLDNMNAKYNYRGVLYLIRENGYCRTDGKYKNLFAAVNVTLKKDVNERTFLYGGVGAGASRRDFGSIYYRYHEYAVGDLGLHSGRVNFKAKWRLPAQMFGGFGRYLNDSWSLSAGYRLRYVPSDFHEGFDDPYYEWFWKSKQNLSHAAEVGLMYQF